MDDITDIADFYNTAADGEHIRLLTHQLEYEMTWRYLKRYLPTQGAILEVGAATGRYTLPLAQRGYQVTAVDLSSVQLERLRQRLADAKLADKVQTFVSDARSLAGVPGQGFDAMLLMGPLYHLVLEDDRKQALRAAFDRLRPGGVIVSAFISRLGILGDLLKNVTGWIEHQDEVRSVMTLGRDPAHYPRGSFRGYFARAEEIAPLLESAGFETLALAGMEPCISADDESYNRLEDDQRRLWLDLLDEVSREPSILAASRHLLYVGRKPENKDI